MTGLFPYIRSLLENHRTLSLGLMGMMILPAWLYLLQMTQPIDSELVISNDTFEIEQPHHPAEPLAQAGATLCTGLTNHSVTEDCRTANSYPNAEHSPHFSMPSLGQSWSPGDFALVFLMWLMMMIAMMLPTAAPMILTYSDIVANNAPPLRLITSVGTFILGYLLIWGAYSIVAVLLQWLLLKSALITDQMVSSDPRFSGMLLIITGLYQWTSLKESCLTHCRTPLQFFLSSWQEGHNGALQMGAKHGAYCVGCCWALMVLMFFFGLMNLLWIAGLSLIMLTEKIIPRGDLFSKLTGLLFFIWGLLIISGHLTL